MKIALASDLHLEFGTIALKNTEGADVLILAGDICVASDFKKGDKRSDRYLDFFKQVSEEFPEVIYIMGNHEHYHGDFAHTIPKLRKVLGDLPNIHILDNETYILNGVTFIGGTLWTDMNQEDPLTMHNMPRMMSDFMCVKNSNKPVYRTVPLYDDGEYNVDRKIIGQKQKAEPGKFSPADAVEQHQDMLDYIAAVTAEQSNEKFVVVSHHCPSHQSVHEQYRGDTLMNGGFTSDCDEFIHYRPQIKLWFHGHTHHPFDYVIGETRVVCNPRGYINYEHFADNFKLKYYEL